MISALDWLFLAVLLGSLLLGMWRGLVYETFSLMGWVAAFVLARWLAPVAAQHLPMNGASDVLRYAVGFALVFVATLVLGGLMAVWLKNMIQSVGLRPVDRALGGAFGLLRGVFLLLLATVLAAMTPFKSDPQWQHSHGVRLSFALLKSIRPMLPRDLDRLMPA